MEDASDESDEGDEGDAHEDAAEPGDEKSANGIEELKSMFEKQAGVEKFDLIQSFHACKQEEGKPVADYILKMKGYVENGTNYNMHNMGKTVGEIHALLIEYEKGLLKSWKTPQGNPQRNEVYYFYFTINKIVVARYAEFFKKRLISQEISRRAVDLEEIQEEEDTTPSEITSNIPQEVEGFEPPQPPQEEVIPIRRSERTRRATNRLCLNVEVEEHSLGDLGEPANYKAAMLDPESKKWVDAMNAEMQSMIDNMVWVLVDLPPNCKTVGSKWIFKKKTDMDGNVHIYKARLVAKGYTQTYMVDYEETFSPVADIRAIRILISIAAFYDYEIWQMDVKTAFLNGYLDEDIYMVQPEGFVDPKHPRKVCKLQRSIYRLKQASRSWNKRFDEEIKKFGFDQNLDEPCVYQKASGSNVTFLILYVDDIIIMGNHIPSLQSVKNYLGKCFSMKDLGEAAFILGIKIYRDRSKRLIGLGQNAYMDKILKRYKNPSTKLRVECYCDAGFETDRDDTKSQTGYVFVLNGGAVDWKSSKQSTIAMSATESEYIVASEAAMEAVWIRKFISGLGIVPTINEPLNMYCDNSAAIHYANEPGVQKGARHYHRRYHYVRECVELGEIRILKVHTDNHSADLL
ncbi:retrotransposon protein, putative, ty1-copia subclass [Tanacetum coccineum]